MNMAENFDGENGEKGCKASSLTESADYECCVVEVKSVDPGLVREVPEDDSPQSVGNADHR